MKIDANLDAIQYHVNDFSIKLNRANAILSKWENMLALNYWDPSILLFLTPTYPTAVLSGLKIVPLFSEL